jgi:Protein of unknown function (DUF3619)
MENKKFAKKVVSLIDESSQQLTDYQVARLANARVKALEAAGLLMTERKSVVFGWSFAVLLQRVRQLVLAPFLVAGFRVVLPLLVVGFVADEAWRNQETLRIEELVEWDVALLDDDLPLAAYNDQGFAEYLNASTSSEVQ